MKLDTNNLWTVAVPFFSLEYFLNLCAPWKGSLCSAAPFPPPSPVSHLCLHHHHPPHSRRIVSFFSVLLWRMVFIREIFKVRSFPFSGSLRTLYCQIFGIFLNQTLQLNASSWVPSLPQVLLSSSSELESLENVYFHHNNISFCPSSKAMDINHHFTKPIRFLAQPGACLLRSSWRCKKDRQKCLIWRDRAGGWSVWARVRKYGCEQSREGDEKID